VHGFRGSGLKLSRGFAADPGVGVEEASANRDRIGAYERAMSVPVAVYLNVYRWGVEKPVDRAVAALVDVENSTSATGNLDEVYKAIKTHIGRVSACLSSARANHLEIHGLGDAKTKTARIAEVFLKTRQAYVVA